MSYYVVPNQSWERRKNSPVQDLGGLRSIILVFPPPQNKEQQSNEDRKAQSVAAGRNAGCQPRKLEDMGLGCEKQRQHYRNLGNWPNYGHIPQQKAGGAPTLQWFRTDKDDSAICTTAAHKHA